MLGATRFRSRIEQFALPLRNVFGAFFFVNFGLALDISTFGDVAIPVIVAVLVTLLVNTLGGQLIAWQNGLTRAEGLNASAMLQNRGEFALILATLAGAAGLDPRLTPFAGLFVLTMAVVGPILAVNSDRIGGVIFAKKPVTPRRSTLESSENIALVEAALAGEISDGDDTEGKPSRSEPRPMVHGDSWVNSRSGADDPIYSAELIDSLDPANSLDPAEPTGAKTIDPTIEQAMQQSDEPTGRRRDPEY